MAPFNQRRLFSDYNTPGNHFLFRLIWQATWLSRSVPYETICRLALQLPGVEESTSYGTPALKVKDKLMLRLHDDGDKVVLRMRDPETYFITDHYREYPWVLVSLQRVHLDALPDLLELAYRAASPTKKCRV